MTDHKCRIRIRNPTPEELDFLQDSELYFQTVPRLEEGVQIKKEGASGDYRVAGVRHYPATVRGISSIVLFLERI